MQLRRGRFCGGNGGQGRREGDTVRLLRLEEGFFRRAGDEGGKEDEEKVMFHMHGSLSVERAFRFSFRLLFGPGNEAVDGKGYVRRPRHHDAGNPGFRTGRDGEGTSILPVEN